MSLTSYPARFGLLRLTLRTLIRQSVAPDRILLWIAHGDLPSLPRSVLRLHQKGHIEIRGYDDIRSYKKIIPAIEECPDAFVVTADDDINYRTNWLEELVETYRANADALCVPFHRGHTVTLDGDGKPLAYSRWRWEETPTVPSRLSMPTGAGGVLYPPGCFYADVTNRVKFQELAPYADDIWLYWMVVLGGYRPVRVENAKPLKKWPTTNAGGLRELNAEQGWNDLQVKRMVDFYGSPAAIAATVDKAGSAPDE
ncbi:hypothetical protein V5738_07860 [Salinisphaera sp. SPP-AMP-43]|uniref:glycosyltransferase family 2 protein n=1 Tax=Salinisphaera sp. SPP-AMP-43 TaxID=3121288 RepID=UPI003C6DE00E